MCSFNFQYIISLYIEPEKPMAHYWGQGQSEQHYTLGVQKAESRNVKFGLWMETTAHTTVGIEIYISCCFSDNGSFYRVSFQLPAW